jgi:acid phosphatase (class A)
MHLRTFGWILFGVMGSLLPATAEVTVNSGSATTSNVQPAAGTPQKTEHYITGKEPVFVHFPAAPSLNSDLDHTDLLITLLAQGSRNSAQVREAINDREFANAIETMDRLVDRNFEKAYPASSKVAQLLKNTEDDAAPIVSMLKKRNGRLRPFVQHPGLVVPIFPVKDFSYPSGHATGAQLHARLLAALFPDCSAKVLIKAKTIADSRVVAGVHYESDIEAGLRLGDLIFSALTANPRFIHDLHEAKDQIARAR